MGSICAAKPQNFASIAYTDLEVAEEQAINDQISTISCNFISSLELQFKSTISSNQIEQQLTKKNTIELPQSQKKIVRKGILKNNNPHYEEELKLLQKMIKQNQDDTNFEILVNYLRARKNQGSYEIYL